MADSQEYYDQLAPAPEEGRGSRLLTAAEGLADGLVEKAEENPLSLASYATPFVPVVGIPLTMGVTAAAAREAAEVAVEKWMNSSEELRMRLSEELYIDTAEQFLDYIEANHSAIDKAIDDTMESGLVSGAGQVAGGLGGKLFSGAGKLIGHAASFGGGAAGEMGAREGLNMDDTRLAGILDAITQPVLRGEDIATVLERLDDRLALQQDTAMARLPVEDVDDFSAPAPTPRGARRMAAQPDFALSA